MTFNNLGLIYALLQEWEQAQSNFDQALHVLGEVGERGAQGRTFQGLGRLHKMLGNKTEALKSFKDALLILREVGDRWGEGETLQNIGKLYFEQGRYNAALAGFLLSKSILEEVQSPSLTETNSCVERLQKEIGEKQFIALLASLQTKAQQIIDQTLLEGMN